MFDFLGIWRGGGRQARKEVQSEYECRRKTTRVKLNVHILIQMSKQYTPKMFGIFQLEYEMTMTTQIEGLTENYYVIIICDIGKIANDSFRVCERVFWDPIDQTVFSGCNKFERWGILCSYGLKVLDSMNIKLLPVKCIGEWIDEAGICIVRDKNGCMIIDNKLDSFRRNCDFYRKFSNIATNASTFEQILSFLHSVLDQVDDKMQNIPNTLKTNGNTSPSTDMMKMLTQSPLGLKKNKMEEKKVNNTKVGMKICPSKKFLTSDSSNKMSL